MDSIGKALHVLSAAKMRCVLNAGGGPDEVSIPWLLREAGARLVAGDRPSTPYEALGRAKYESSGGGRAEGRGLMADALKDLRRLLEENEFVVELEAAEVAIGEPLETVPDDRECWSTEESGSGGGDERVDMFVEKRDGWCMSKKQA